MVVGPVPGEPAGNLPLADALVVGLIGVTNAAWAEAPLWLAYGALRITS